MTFHHERRLDRALHHLEHLKAEVKAWSEERPYRVWTEFDVDELYKLTWLEVLEQSPSDLSLIVGDCIHNLRSALDNLVHELALAYIGIDPLPEGRARGLEFPVFGDREMTTRECRNKIGCIDPRAQADIKGLQPYNRGERFRRDPLWQLHQLSNMDKHRLPHVVLFAPQAIAFFVPDNLTASDIQSISGPIETCAPIARYPAFDKTGAKVDVYPTPSFSVGFSQRVPEELRGWSVPTRLALISDHIISKVLPSLHPYLTRMPLVEVNQPYCLLRDKSVRS